jgi:hypothetical protein
MQTMMKEQFLDEANETLGDFLLRLRDDESPLWVMKGSAFVASKRIINRFGYHPMLVLAFENQYLHAFVIFVHGKDEESATNAATIVLNLQDDIFDMVKLSSEKVDYRMHLPFSCHQIQSILQTNPQREYKLENYELTKQQAWTLSTTDISTPSRNAVLSMGEGPFVLARVVGSLPIKCSHLTKVYPFTKIHGMSCVVYSTRALSVVFGHYVFATLFSMEGSRCPVFRTSKSSHWNAASLKISDR